MEINKPISSVLIFIIALVMLFLFVIPKYGESVSLEGILNERRAEYSGKSQYYTDIYETLRSIKEKKEVVEKIDSALPANVSFAQLVYFLQKKAVESGLVSRSVGFSQVASAAQTKASGGAGASNELKIVSLTVNLLGNYQGIKNFVMALEKSSRIFEVASISFGPADLLQASNPDSLQVYNIRMELKTYTY